MAISIPFDGGLVLFDPSAQEIRVLNSGAAAIWTLLEAGLSTGEAATALCAHTGLTAEKAAEHVEDVRLEWDLPEKQWASTSFRSSTNSLNHQAPKIYRIGGTGFGFSSNDSETRLRVECALSDCLEPEADPEFWFHVSGGDEQQELELLKDGVGVISSFDSGEIAGALFQAILEAIHPGIEWLGLMHGAAVARDGLAILLPGASGAGKSTLAAFLAARGYDYISDDLVALRDDANVMPWPTPFSIKRGSWRVIAPLYGEFDSLDEVELYSRRIKFVPVGRAPWTKRPQQVRGIVFPEFRKNLPTEIEPIAPINALGRLVDERLWLGYPIAEERLRRFLEWFENVPAYRLGFSDLNCAERQIRETLGVGPTSDCPAVLPIQAERDLAR